MKGGHIPSIVVPNKFQLSDIRFHDHGSGSDNSDKTANNHANSRTSNHSLDGGYYPFNSYIKRFRLRPKRRNIRPFSLRSGDDMKSSWSIASRSWMNDEYC